MSKHIFSWTNPDRFTFIMFIIYHIPHQSYVQILKIIWKASVFSFKSRFNLFETRSCNCQCTIKHALGMMHVKSRFILNDQLCRTMKTIYLQWIRIRGRMRLMTLHSDNVKIHCDSLDLCQTKLKPGQLSF